MKLYTEEQVKNLLDKMDIIYSLEELIPIEISNNDIETNKVLELYPLELPSDEEIQEKSKYWNETTNPNMFTFKLAWENGAIRLKKQILNQNK